MRLPQTGLAIWPELPFRLPLEKLPIGRALLKKFWRWNWKGFSSFPASHWSNGRPQRGRIFIEMSILPKCTTPAGVA